MLGGDPNKPRSLIGDADVHQLHAQVVALKEIVRALISAMPDPTAARISIREELEAVMSMGLAAEHWRTDEHAEITGTFDDVIGCGEPKFFPRTIDHLPPSDKP